LTLIATDQSAKRLQLIKERSPTVARVAVLWNANASGHRLQIREMEQAAPALGIALQSLPIRSVDEIDARLRLAVDGNAQALLTMDDAVVQSQREHIAQLATRQRLPLMSEFRPGTESSGLISYGPDIGNMWRRAAVFVDKIFKGAKPGDLPVEQPTKFELIVSLKTAKAIEIEIPTSILLRADEVIE
jgi:putative tryptophan/tyrosine transport system substrate-binding protein